MQVTAPADTLQAVVISGLKGATAAYADIVYNGQVLDFSQGQTYTISVADINAESWTSISTMPTRSTNSRGRCRTPAPSPIRTATTAPVLSNTGTTSISTPIALDLNGDGKIGVTGATSSYDKDANAALGHTVQFDMNGDGTKEITEWFNAPAMAS